MDSEDLNDLNDSDILDEMTDIKKIEKQMSDDETHLYCENLFHKMLDYCLFHNLNFLNVDESSCVIDLIELFN